MIEAHQSHVLSCARPTFSTYFFLGVANGLFEAENFFVIEEKDNFSFVKVRI